MIAAACLVLGAAPAHAYIDPGAGSIILQGVVGAIAGGLFVLRAYWSKAKAFFAGGRAADREAPPRSPEESGA